MRLGTLWFVLAAAVPYAILGFGFSGSGQKVPSYKADIVPILKGHCLSCHSGSGAKAGLDLSSPESILKVISKGDSKASVLMQRVRGEGGLPAMPKGFVPLSKEQIGTLAAWIDGGASFGAGPDFASEVLPLLRGRCGSCHGAEKPQGDLDVTSGAALLKSGTVLAGNPDESILLRRIVGLDGLPRMPKGFAPLDEKETQLIREWIAAGAHVSTGPGHWAYQPVVRPALPKIRRKAWVKNFIDAFVLSKLEAEGLSPSPEASKETLIRRVSLDLIGLPPTPAEVDAFLKDSKPGAYERVVDRLLKSPHYGERQARIWLDLARYADTNGYEADRTRQAYLYRDWVINAYNANMAFDRFTIEQIAGDLLPSATVDQLVATGFHRNSMFNEEGGVDPRESMYETILDRVATTSTVWLGSTMACARCHDHKFDPISQKDFYSMYAFFGNNVYETRGDNNVGAMKFYEPSMRIATPEQEKAQKTLTAKIAELDKVLSAPIPAKEIEEWEARLTQPGLFQTPAVKIEAASKSEFERQADGLIKPLGATPNQDKWTLSIDLPNGKWTGLRIETLPDNEFPASGPGRASSGNFILSRVDVEVDGKPLAFGRKADLIQGGYDLNGLIDQNPETGWAIYPGQGKAHELMLSFEKPLIGPQKLKLVLDMGSQQWPQHILGKIRISATEATEPERLVVNPEVRSLLGKKDRSSAESAVMEKAYAMVRPSFRKARAGREEAQRQLQELQAKIPFALVMKDKPAKGPLKAYVHSRGEFLSPTEEVFAATPAVLPPMKPTSPGNRLGLAEWLVSKENPLTARVQVNRMWEQYFGRGIVETSEDLGTQGSKPTHPELLNWLAAEFMERNWDMKAMHRLIVTSATYRQSSAISRDLLERDPRNELLARGPRFRMEAEMIRDSALAAAGLLNPKVGGPSVYPVQPDGIWDSPYSGERWMTAANEDRFRRGLYTFWKRTSPYPTFVALDAGSRETCVTRRIRTNTPLQALALLNDRAFLEAASGLANKMAEGRSDADKIRIGLRRVLSRYPSEKESARLVQLLLEMRKRYATNTGESKKLGESPELAALTMVANVILNLDEALTKG
ncbi:MAG: PSD1 and planctomycete cytochrome C domain-containing protein [Fimbriimonadaceae bacterium]|nr:PSD1 and planctomycete cytochrome C domain-containing protein [Fimbriimonadaceae bacterium]